MVVLARDGVEVASWPLEVHGPVDLSVVDDLARLQLAARRLGCSIRLRDPSGELTALLAFLGLARAIAGSTGPARWSAYRWSGRPNAGKRVVSRKLWCPTIRSPEISMTWIDHGCSPPSGPGL